MNKSQTYLTTDELSKLIKYDSRTIRERLKDSVLLEGVHYIRPFGGRKILCHYREIVNFAVLYCGNYRLLRQ
jgi:hypothetical protein